MSTDRIDPETLAAFLEGKLSGTEREAVRRKLAEGGEDFDVMADTAAVAAELSEADSSNRAVIPLRRRQIPWKWIVPLAAGIGAVLFLPQLVNRNDVPEIALLSEANAFAGTSQLPGGWDQVSWPAVRGGAATERSGGEFRAGVQATGLLIASRIQDAAAIRTIAADLADGLKELPGAGASVATLNAVDPLSDSSTERAVDEVHKLLGESSWYELGNWVAQVRIARQVGAESLFGERGAATAELQRIAGVLRAETPASERAAAVLTIIDPMLRSLRDRSALDADLDVQLTNLINAAAQ